MDATVKLADILMIVAVLVAPLVALQVAGTLDRRREGHQRRVAIFKKLMATRARRLDPSHVEALNMIDIEFYGKSKQDRRVVQAWRAYLDILSDQNLNGDVLAVKREDAFVEVMHQMSTALGYDLSKTDLKNTSYFPKGHGEQEEAQLVLRKGLTDLFSNKTALPVGIAWDIRSANDDNKDPKADNVIDLEEKKAEGT